MAEAFGPALLLACWLAAPPDELDLVFDGAAFLLLAELELLFVAAEPFLFRLLPASASESVPSSEAVEVVFRRFLLAAAFLLAFF